jgi:hypothetical protein
VPEAVVAFTSGAIASRLASIDRDEARPAAAAAAALASRCLSDQSSGVAQ